MGAVLHRRPAAAQWPATGRVVARPVQLVYTDNPGSLPASYTLPSGFDLEIQSVVVRVDGTSAAGQFVPCLAVYSQDGRLMARVRPERTFQVGDTGVVTFAPFLKAPRVSQTLIGCRVENLGGQTVSTSTNTTRDFNTEIFDTDSMVDLAADNSKVTFNTEGIYLIISAVNFAANATGRRISIITINGTYGAGTGTNIGAQSAPALTEAGARTNAQAVVVYEFSVGDYITAGCFQSSGGNLVEGGAGSASNSFLAVTRVGV